MNMLKKRNGLFPGLKPEFPELLNVNSFFDSQLLRNELSPAVNIKETEKDFEVEVSAPGLSKNDFQIEVDGGRLNISYQKEEEKEEKEDRYRYQEFTSRSFQRTFSIPEVVNEEKIGAKYEDGILKVTLEKGEEKKKENIRKIAIS